MRSGVHRTEIEPPLSEALERSPEIPPPDKNNPNEIARAAAVAVTEYSNCKISKDALINYILSLRENGWIE